MKAVIYARVSTREQEETGYSLDAQRDLLSKYASENNLEVVKIFSASESASGKKDRVIFREMLEFTMNENIDHIICEKTDRLTRNPKDAAIIGDWTNANQSRRVHFVKDGFVASHDTKAHEGLVWNMKVSIAKFYTDNLSEEVKKGNAAKIKLGWMPGPPKLGYKTVGESGHKIHEPDEATAPLVTKMFELYASGQYSLKALTEEVHGLGLRSKTGRKITKSALARFLSNPFYYGYFEWNGSLYKGNHTPLISKDTFDRVQTIKSGKTVPSHTKHNFLFKGRIRCKECGGIVTWETKKGHAYGHCNKYRKCSKRSYYKEGVFSSKIAKILGGLVLENKRFADWLKKALKESNASETEYRERVNESIKTSVDRVERKLSTLYDDRLENRISVSLYDQKSVELQIERDMLLGKIQSNLAVGDKSREIGISLYDLSQQGATLFEAGTLDQKQKLVSLVFDKLYVENGELGFTYTYPFQVLAEAVNVTNSSKTIKSIKSPIQIFEPQEDGSVKSPFAGFGLACPNVLPDRDSNPNTQDQNLVSYH